MSLMRLEKTIRNAYQIPYVLWVQIKKSKYFDLEVFNDYYEFIVDKNESKDYSYDEIVYFLDSLYDEQILNQENFNTLKWKVLNFDINYKNNN